MTRLLTSFLSFLIICFVADISHSLASHDQFIHLNELETEQLCADRHGASFSDTCSLNAKAIPSTTIKVAPERSFFQIALLAPIRLSLLRPGMHWLAGLASKSDDILQSLLNQQMQTRLRSVFLLV